MKLSSTHWCILGHRELSGRFDTFYLKEEILIEYFCCTTNFTNILFDYIKIEDFSRDSRTDLQLINILEKFFTIKKNIFV